MSISAPGNRHPAPDARCAALLQSGRVKVVLGYRARGGRRIPVLLTDAAGAADWSMTPSAGRTLPHISGSPRCASSSPRASSRRRPVMRSLVLLAAESQIPADAVTCAWPSGRERIPRRAGPAGRGATAAREIRRTCCRAKSCWPRSKELAAMSDEERAAFWTEQFSKCTRCYACRAACPGCYCQCCLAEKNVPQWISTTALAHGNFAWNIIRAFHQAGRCTLCGACEAACPQGLPLMLLNVHVAECAEKEFGHKPGYDLAEKPLIGSWSPDDEDGFVR